MLHESETRTHRYNKLPVDLRFLESQATTLEQTKTPTEPLWDKQIFSERHAVMLEDKAVSRNDSVNSDTCLNNNTLADNYTCLDNVTLIKNYTVDNGGDERLGDDANLALVYFGFVLLCGMLLTLCCCLIAVRIMLRCRKLSLSIRVLSVNLLIAFIVNGLSTFLCHIVLRIIDEDSPYYLVTFVVRMVLFSVFMSVMWCSVSVVVIERFIAIEFPYHYVTFNKKSTICSIIVCKWTINTIVPCVLVVVNWLKFCGADKFLSECEGFAILRPFRIFVASTSCICFVVTVIVYSKISHSIRRHTREERNLQVRNTIEQSTQNSAPSSPLSSSKTILIIILSFIVLQFPYLFFSILTELRPEFWAIEWRQVIHLMCRICHEINVYITLFLYIWKFSECRMNFYYMFSKLNNKYKTKAESLRLEVYNIVTFEKSTNVISEL